MTRTETPTVTEILTHAIDTHGTFKVVIATIKAVMRRHGPMRPLSIDELPNDLRKDIGLPPLPDPLKPWEHMD